MMSLFLSMLDNETDRINFERIYKKYSDGIFRRVLSMTRNVQDAEDIVQECWIKAAKNMALFRGRDESMIRSYIMRIAYHETVSFARTKKREAALVTELEDAEPLMDDGELFTVCEREGVETILACIRELGDVYSETLIYHYLYHYTPKEIATMLDMKEITVRKRISRGRERLVKLLERRGIHD